MSPRLIPNSIEAEQSVLGGIMLNNQAFYRIENVLTPTDFYHKHHQIIFSSILDMFAERKPIDVVTVSDWMKGRCLPSGEHFIDFIGGLAYLGDLAKDTPSSANIIAYAGIVRNHSMRRQFIELGSSIIDQSYDNSDASDASIEKLTEFTVAGAFALEQKKEEANKGFTTLKDALKEQVARIQTLNENKEEQLLGSASTLDDLDKKLSGFEKGKVYVLAGRPAMGKTTLGLNIVEGIAQTTKNPVAVFSIEMPTGDVVQKMMSSAGRVDFAHLRNPWELNSDDWPHVTQGIKKLSGMDIFFDDSSRQTPADIRSRCRRLIQDTGKPLSAVLIDYVQLMGGSRDKAYFNKEAEINYISGEVRAMAKDFECPIILISQLNRSVESRPNKRPVMSDLRDSGALEQDASAIIFVYRDEVYDENTADKGVAELIVAKHRGGQTGTVRCRWVGHHQRFEDFGDDYSNYQDDGSGDRTAIKNLMGRGESY